MTFPLVDGCMPTGPIDNPTDERTLIIFHNGSGPMCLEALTWLEEISPQHPELIIDEKLVFDHADLDLLGEMKDEYGRSQGISTSFGYLPVIFFRDHAFFGFNDEVAAAIGGLLESTE